MRFPVNLTALAMRMMDVISTITLLQEMGILPLGIACNTCSTNLGPYTTNHNYHYFECNSCKTKTSILNHTVLSNSNTKRQQKVPCENWRRGRCGWNRRIYVWKTQVWKRRWTQEAQTVDFWWSFTHISSSFHGSMPGQQENQKVSLAADTGKHSWRINNPFWWLAMLLPQLNYSHRWINHDLHYVDPNDPSLHTNTIEGLWGKFILVQQNWYVKIRFLGWLVGFWDGTHCWYFSHFFRENQKSDISEQFLKFQYCQYHKVYFCPVFLGGTVFQVHTGTYWSGENNSPCSTRPFSADPKAPQAGRDRQPSLHPLKEKHERFPLQSLNIDINIDFKYQLV